MCRLSSFSLCVDVGLGVGELLHEFLSEGVVHLLLIKLEWHQHSEPCSHVLSPSANICPLDEGQSEGHLVFSSKVPLYLSV